MWACFNRSHYNVYICFLFRLACRKSLLIYMIILSHRCVTKWHAVVISQTLHITCHVYFFSVTGILGTNSSEKVLLLMYSCFLSPSDSSVKCLLSSAAMASTPPPLMKKHSQTDLVSRLKSRKVLGVGGEDDDGEVHRSKVTSHLPASVFIFDLNSSYSWKKACFYSYPILQYSTIKGQILKNIYVNIYVICFIIVIISSFSSNHIYLFAYLLITIF